MNTARALFWCAGLIGIAFGATQSWAAEVIVSTRGHAAPVVFALRKLEALLSSRGDSLSQHESEPSEAMVVIRPEPSAEVFCRRIEIRPIAEFPPEIRRALDPTLNP